MDVLHIHFLFLFNYIFIIVTNQNKIILVGINQSRILDVITAIVSRDDNINIANTFTTNSEYKDMPMSSNWKVYLDNDELYYAYKNNALLCVEMVDKQISEGITIQEFENADVIPMNYEMFNNISPKVIKGISIAWVDDLTVHRNRIMVAQTKEFMELSRNIPTLYFTDLDDTVSIADYIYRYITTENKLEKEKILSECN
jgi:hypothetical protein